MSRNHLLISFVCLLIFNSLPLKAQPSVEDEFRAALEKLNAEVMPPLDGDYKAWRPLKNLTQNSDWAIRSRKEKLEIRFLTSTVSDNQPTMKYPSIAAHRLALHICSNEENTGISARDLTEHEQEDLFNADWGRIYIFRPKLDFAQNAYCKMVALHKEGKGMAYIFYLFDEPSPNIDNRLYAFRFIPDDW